MCGSNRRLFTVHLKPLSEPTARQLARSCSTIVGVEGGKGAQAQLRLSTCNHPHTDFHVEKFFLHAPGTGVHIVGHFVTHTASEAQERAIPPKMRYEHGKSSKCVILCCRSSLVEYDCDSTLSGLLCVPRARRQLSLSRCQFCDKTLVPSRVLSGRGLAR